MKNQQNINSKNLDFTNKKSDSKLHFDPENLHQGYYISDEDDEVGDVKFHAHKANSSTDKTKPKKKSDS